MKGRGLSFNLPPTHFLSRIRSNLSEAKELILISVGQALPNPESVMVINQTLIPLHLLASVERDGAIFRIWDTFTISNTVDLLL